MGRVARRRGVAATDPSSLSDVDPACVWSAESPDDGASMVATREGRSVRVAVRVALPGGSARAEMVLDARAARSLARWLADGRRGPFACDAPVAPSRDPPGGPSGDDGGSEGRCINAATA